MELTLLLNATYEPLRVVNWQKAHTLLWQGKVEVLEVYDREIHGVSISIKLPAVMRLLKMVKLREAHRSVKFSRINIFTRDGFRCQYCRRKFHTEDLTFDHVIPIAKGGNKTWENIVTACWGCNNRKSGRLPEEAGMHLMRKPLKPKWNPVVTITIGVRNTPESWRDYLYWNVELDSDIPEPLRSCALRAREDAARRPPFFLYSDCVEDGLDVFGAHHGWALRVLSL